MRYGRKFVNQTRRRDGPARLMRLRQLERGLKVERVINWVTFGVVGGVLLLALVGVARAADVG